MLPRVLQSVGEEPDHQEPCGPGDTSRGHHHECQRDGTLNGDDPRAPVSDCEPDVDERDRGESQRVYGGRIEPPEAERRRNLERAYNHSPHDRWSQVSRAVRLLRHGLLLPAM